MALRVVQTTVEEELGLQWVVDQLNISQPIAATPATPDEIVDQHMHHVLAHFSHQRHAVQATRINGLLAGKSPDQLRRVEEFITALS